VSKLGDLLTRLFLHAQRVFHLLVAVVFFFLTLAGVTVSLAEWRYYRQSPSVGLVRFGLLAGFTVLLFIFCLYSFVKARSVR
jgi:hypothetical protein